MKLIEVRPELVDMKVWMMKKSETKNISNPQSSGSMDNFTLELTEYAHIKLVTVLTKPMGFGGKKTDILETHMEAITLDQSSMPFTHSEFYKSQEENERKSANKYMMRILGALNTIESVTLNASQTQTGDTQQFAIEEKEARRRLQKADTRLINLISAWKETEKESEWVPVFLSENVPHAVTQHITGIRD